MARTSSYRDDANATLEDRIFGTNQSPGHASETVNFRLSQIRDLFVSGSSEIGDHGLFGVVPFNNFPVMGTDGFKHSRIVQVDALENNISIDNVSFVPSRATHHLRITNYALPYDLTSFIDKSFTSTEVNASIRAIASIESNIDSDGNRDGSVNVDFTVSDLPENPSTVTNFVLSSADLSSTDIQSFLNVTGDVTYTDAAGNRLSLRDLTAASTPVTLSGLDYATLTGQNIELGQIDLTTDVTGELPDANIPASIARDTELHNPVTLSGLDYITADADNNQLLVLGEISVDDDTNLSVRSSITSTPTAIGISLTAGEILIFDPNADNRVRRLVIQNNITGGTLGTDYFLDVASDDNGVAGTDTAIMGEVGETFGWTVTPRLATGRRWVGVAPQPQTISGTFASGDAAEEISTLTFTGTNAALALPTITIANTVFSVDNVNNAVVVSPDATITLNDYSVGTPTFTASVGGLTQSGNLTAQAAAQTITPLRGVILNSLPQTATYTVMAEAADGSTTTITENLVIGVPAARPSFASAPSASGFVFPPTLSSSDNNTLERYDTGTITTDLTLTDVDDWTIDDTNLQEVITINDPATQASYTQDITRNWNYAVSGTHNPHNQSESFNFTTQRSLRFGSMPVPPSGTLAEAIAALPADETGLGDFNAFNDGTNTVIMHDTINPSGQRITINIRENSMLFMMYNGIFPDLISITQVGPGFDLLNSATFTLHSAQADGFKLYTTSNRLIPGEITLDLT